MFQPHSRFLIPVLAALLSGPAIADDSKKQSLDDFKRTALRREAEGAWKKIDWQPSVGDAIEKSKKDSKPLLVVLVVGRLGQKGAAEC